MVSSCASLTLIAGSIAASAASAVFKPTPPPAPRALKLALPMSRERDEVSQGKGLQTVFAISHRSGVLQRSF
jgi:hypothetical protein